MDEPQDMVLVSVNRRAYGHSWKKVNPGQYRISWTFDRKVAGSRLRFPQTMTRDTDLEGAIRFAKKWKLAQPVDEGRGAVSDNLLQVIAFLRSIGIECEIQHGVTGFLPGVRIHCGGLLIAQDVFIGDVLHEAGHLSVLPGRFRRLASDNIDTVTKLMMDSLDFNDPDGGEARAALQSGDAEATAWAWAVGEHLLLEPSQVVRNRDYDGTGRDVRMALQARAYLGINGLAHAGFCVTRPGPLEKARGLPAYPKLAMWVQHDFAAVERRVGSAA